MQVIPIQNTNLNMGFKSSEDLEKASDFINMNDNQLRRLAFKINYNKKEQDEKNKKILYTTFWAIPIFDIISSGVLNKNAVISESKDAVAVLLDKASPLSIKAHGALTQAGKWGMVLGVFGLYKLIKDAVAPQTKNTKNNNPKNPISSVLIDIGILLGGITLASFGGKKIMEQFHEKFDKIQNKYINVLNKLDETKLNTKALPGIRKFAEKFPTATAAGKFMLANSIWIILGVGIFKLFDNVIKQHNKVDRTYQKLKTSQAETAKHLANSLRVETDILAQNQMELKEELKQARDCCEKCVPANEVILEIRTKAVAKEKDQMKEKEAEEIKMADEPETIDKAGAPKEDSEE